MTDEELHDDIDDVQANTSGRKRDRAADTDSEDDGPTDKGDGDVAGARRKRGRLVREVGDDDDDDFEGLGGKEMVEEEDEDESDWEDSDEDYDGLAEGADDRRKLAKMSELERELELTERAERRQKERERKMLLSGLGDSSKEAAQPPKPQARREKPKPKPVSDDDDERDEEKQARDVRRSSRQKTATKASKAEALQKMKDQRQRKDEAASLAQTLEDEEAAALEEEEITDDDDGYGMDVAEELRDDHDMEEVDEASFDDVLQMQVLRSHLEEWVSKPFLEDTLVGCIVRVSAGMRTDDYGQQVSIYVICPILEVITGKPYKLPHTGASVDKYLVVRNGKRKHTVQISLVSNSPIDREEYLRFHTDNVDNSEPQIQKHEAQEAAQKLAAVHSYTLTADDLNRMVQEKRAKGQIRLNPALEKGRLTRERDELRALGQYERAAEVEAKLEKLIAEMKEQAKATKALSSLNAKARQSNLRALQASHDPHGKSAMADPFERRVTRPIQYWATKAETKEEEKVPELVRKQSTVEEDAAATDPVEIWKSVEWKYDKSLLRGGRGQPLMARRILGPGWYLSKDRMAVPGEAKNGLPPVFLSLAEYKKKVGLS